MKIFAIRDAEDKQERDLAYLFYYEKEQKFFIELPEGADPWAVPMMLSSFAKRKEYSVDEKWSRIWVQQRIVPAERQNIGQIIRDNKLNEYDEYKLLMLSMGRCEQDDCYLVPIKEEDLPVTIKERYADSIDTVLPLSDKKLLVFFKNGITKKYDATAAFRRLQIYYSRLSGEDAFYQVKVDTGGRGLSWGSEVRVHRDEVLQNGESLPLTMDDLSMIAEHSFVNAAEAAQILNCSRQNINDLVKKGRLHPIKKSEKNTLFMKGEILAYLQK